MGTVWGYQGYPCILVSWGMWDEPTYQGHRDQGISSYGDGMRWLWGRGGPQKGALELLQPRDQGH